MKKFENTSLKRDDWRSTNIIWRGKLSRNIWRKRGINSRFLFSFIPKLAHFLKNLFSIWHFFKHYLFSFFSLFFFFGTQSYPNWFDEQHFLRSQICLLSNLYSTPFFLSRIYTAKETHSFSLFLSLSCSLSLLKTNRKRMNSKL